MSRRTRYADNSKRQQPVQQQRAQAAQQVASQRKIATPAGQRQAQGRAGEQEGR